MKVMFEKMENIVKTLHIVNDTPQADIDKIMNIMFNKKEIGKLEILGSGAFGCVYKVVGENGFEYAVKFVHNIDDDQDVHDAHVLEQLQGSDCYLKLLFYIDGTLDRESYWDDKMVTQKYLIMVTPRVKGYTLNEINNSNKKISEFEEHMNNCLLEKFKDALQLSIDKGFKPADLHRSNMMFDMDKGDVVIVDVGNYRYSKNNDNLFLRKIDDSAPALEGVKNVEGILSKLPSLRKLPSYKQRGA